MYKQILILRKDLNMSIGKACAQASHASIAFLSWMIRDNIIGEVIGKNVYRTQPLDIDKDLYNKWINGEYTKVVLQAKNKNHLLKAKTMAEETGMTEGKEFWCIYDNCYTELEPEEFDEDGVGKTLTCIGFKPMDSEIIDKIGRKYHLYV